MNTVILFLLAFQAGAGHPTSSVRLPGSQGEVTSSVLPGLATESQEAAPTVAARYKSGEVDLRKVKAVRKGDARIGKVRMVQTSKIKVRE